MGQLSFKTSRGEPEQLLEAAGAEKAQLFFAGGYCKSILAHIDPQNSMADAISQLKDMDFGSDLSDLERLGVILSQRLMLLDKAYAAQDETMAMLLQDAEKMSKDHQENSIPWIGEGLDR